MRVSLQLHPDYSCGAVTGIDVELFRPRPGALGLCYLVAGSIDDILFPSPEAPMRTDGLWQHTCFEAFVRRSGPAYQEFNFSPSTQWAAYSFTGYREGMSQADIVPPRIEVRTDEDCYQLRVELDHLPTEVVQLGLSAVIEEQSGRKSYWALAHPGAKADFHHPDCFTLQLPAAYTP